MTGAYPRQRAIAVERGGVPDPDSAAAADARANARLADAIRRAGLEPAHCVGADPAGTHEEASFWVWDATPAQAIAWGRAADQFAVVCGDGARAALVTCFPEAEPPELAPDVVLLVHAPGDDGDGSPALLERELRARSWGETRFLRPSLALDLPPGTPDRIGRLDDALRTYLASVEVPPILAVGFGESGLAVLHAAVPWRIAIGAPWSRLPPMQRTREGAFPGSGAIVGGASASAGAEIAAIPPRVPRLVDAEAGDRVEAWVGRAADGVIRLWSTPTAMASARAAGWRTTGYQGEVREAGSSGNSVGGGLLIAAGVLLGLLGIAVAVGAFLLYAVFAACAGVSGAARAPTVGFFLTIAAALVVGIGGGGGLLWAGARLARAGGRPLTHPIRRESVSQIPAGVRAGAVLLIGAMAFYVAAQVGVSIWAVAGHRSIPFWLQGLVIGVSVVIGFAGAAVLFVSAVRRR